MNFKRFSLMHSKQGSASKDDLRGSVINNTSEQV